MNKYYNFLKVTAISPDVAIGNFYKNQEIIINHYKKAKADIVVFPELSLTGASCKDLFFQDSFAKKIECCLYEMSLNTCEKILIVGTPIYVDNTIYNCAVIMQNQKILGIVPKTIIPDEQKRWFSSFYGKNEWISILNEDILFGNQLIFKDMNTNYTFSIEFGSDLEQPISPNFINDTDIVLNLSAIPTIVEENDIINSLIQVHSKKYHCGYVYVSAGANESTTDSVCSGRILSYQDGVKLKETEWEIESSCFFDIDKIHNKKKKTKTNYNLNFDLEKNKRRIIYIATNDIDYGNVSYSRTPFIPKENVSNYCNKIIRLQAQGLATRLKKAHISKVVLGVSGGLDSTLALLVCVEAMKLLELPNKNIIGITMPGFGTSLSTKQSSDILMEEFQITAKTISIKNACESHLKDISHNGSLDITYENAQARERTQILMDVANQEGALVVGTGDLSELALGWCTYNGDHMSMYGVNASIPKTLIQVMLQSYQKEESNIKISNCISSILKNPVSPELLPPDKEGKIVQKTEDKVGKYLLNDFFLYHIIENQFSYEKILYIALEVFYDFTETELKNTLSNFYHRFFSQQFKRSCMPDGPKVGLISLSPREGFLLPSDVDLESLIP